MFKPNKQNQGFFIFKLIFSVIILCAACAGIIAVLVITTYPKLPSMNELRDYQPKLPLQIYSSDKILLGQFGEERRIFISFNNTPKMLVGAILSAEDERFYQHGGIDYIGVVRALVSNIISGRKQSGASTITMQVARNFFLSSQKTYTRKFNEVLLSYKIENSLTKDQILELYINQIYLGQRAYGFAEAALTYFGKPLDKLSIAEYAVLAGLPKAPSAYNPVVNKKRSHEREMYVLGRMRANNFITQQQYEQAINEKIIIARGSINDETDAGGYVAEMVRQMLYNKYGDNVYTDGYKVYTTIDSGMEKAAYISLRNGLLQFDVKQGYRGPEQQLSNKDKAASEITNQEITAAFDTVSDYGDLQVAVVTQAANNFLKVKLRNGNMLEFKNKDLDFVRKYLTVDNDKQLKRGSIIRVRNINGSYIIFQVPQVEGAIVALDPNNGSIKALVGGFDFTHNNFNHVTQAMRQPGSGFKPFIYSAALEDGFSANTMIDDSEICFPSGGENNGQWCPRNDENEFYGPVSFRQALTFSLNVSTIKILNQITPQYAIDYLTKFGFDKSQFQPYLTLALGVNDVTPMQMAEGYSIFANGGYLVNPFLISTITDSKGNIVAKTDVPDIRKNDPTISSRNAFVMNSILQDVVRYGTGARVYRELKRNDIAGKTGTTSDAKDVWFNGYTPNLTTITWVGYDNPRTLGAHAYGATVALPIWLDFMRYALNKIPEASLPIPAGITVLHNATWKNNDEYVYTSESNANTVPVPAAGPIDNSTPAPDLMESFISKVTSLNASQGAAVAKDNSSDVKSGGENNNLNASAVNLSNNQQNIAGNSNNASAGKTQLNNSAGQNNNTNESNNKQGTQTQTKVQDLINNVQD